MTDESGQGTAPLATGWIVALIISGILAVIVASVVLIYFDATGGIPHGADITETEAAAQADALMDDALALVDPALIERADVADDEGYCGNNYNDKDVQFRNRNASVNLVLVEGVSADTVMQTVHDAYEKRGPEAFFSVKDDDSWTISVESDKESNGSIAPGLYFRASLDDTVPRWIQIVADSDCYLRGQ